MKKKILLIHDANCEFPQVSELQKKEKTPFLEESRIFDSIAITFYEKLLERIT
jgi:hypothetical protein